MKNCLSGLAHSTFGAATLEEQPPCPPHPCRICHSAEWREGAGTWVCGVCHPVPDERKPEADAWKLRYPKVNAWEGSVEFWVALNKAK